MVRGCKGSVVTDRTLRREEQVRWTAEHGLDVRAVPLNGGQGDPDIDELMLEEEIDSHIADGGGVRGPGQIHQNFVDPIPKCEWQIARGAASRGGYIKKHGLDKHWYSTNCLGCK